MEGLLKTDWEQCYSRYIATVEFDNQQLKELFLALLNSRDVLERERLWSEMRDQVLGSNEAFKLANPFYLGVGNPNSDILFVGREKAFNIGEHPELLVKESINNILQWKYIQANPNGNYLEELGYNPLFPKAYHRQQLPPRHTWSIYSNIVAGLVGGGLTARNLFVEADNINQSLFNYCFSTELNHIPAAYNGGGNVVDARKDLLRNDFYKKFSKVIVGVGQSASNELLRNLFGLNNAFEEVILGHNKAGEIRAQICIEGNRKVILCRQLSGAAGWTNAALAKLVNQMH